MLRSAGSGPSSAPRGDSPRYPRLIARLEAALRRPRVGSTDVSLLGGAAAEFRKLRRAVKALPGRPSAEDLGEHQDTVVIQGYLHEVMDRTEPGRALAQSLIRGQRKRRKKARAASFEEWPRLDRRGRKAWSV